MELTPQQIDELSEFYWDTDLSITELEDYFGLMKPVHEYTLPLITGEECLNCSAILIYPTRSARDRDEKECQACGHLDKSSECTCDYCSMARMLEEVQQLKQLILRNEAQLSEIRDLTETERAEGEPSHGVRGRHSEVEDVIRYWAECRDTPTVTDYDRDAIYSFMETYNSAWIKYAIRMATRQPQRNYVKSVEALLKRWAKDGGPDQKKATYKQRDYIADLLRKHGTTLAKSYHKSNYDELTQLDAHNLINDLTPSLDKHEQVPNQNELTLYEWQREALEEWENKGHQGIIEAVTGAGKTRVAIAAAERQLRRGGKVAIVVPTADLLYQWKREVEQYLNTSIGLLGDGSRSDLSRCNVLLAIAQSACRHQLVPSYGNSLLIADEVHRYGSESWSRALETGFDRRLGLTATYERNDRGCEEYLNPYFGGVVFSVDYERALREGIIAPFKIAFIGVEFSQDEREQYEEYDEKVSRYRYKLVDTHGLPEEPFGDFMLAVNQLVRSEQSGASFDASNYLSAFTKRREVLANAQSKYKRLNDLTATVREAEKTILFVQTRKAAEKATEPFVENGIRGAVLESKMTKPERKQVLAGFESGEHELVAAPKLLDEGIDVAAADLAIILAASRSRRQMIQRMGRVLRRKEGGRIARLAVLYVQDTSEDPDVAHEGFLDLVMPVAEDIRTFDSRASANAICNYLSP